MTDFKSLLIDLQQKSNPINVAIPEVGIISVLIKSIQKDIVSLQPTSPFSEYYLRTLHINYYSYIGIL